MKLLEHFKKLRKAQLQEYYLRWFPKEEMSSDRDKLVERLAAAMQDPKRIRERFERLGRSGQDFIASMLTLRSFRGSVKDVRAVPRAQTIEDYEIESLLKDLLDEGWLVAVTETSNGVRSDAYVLPEEIGQGLRITVSIDNREAAAMLSLERHLADLAREKDSRVPELSLAMLCDPDSIEARMRKIADPDLRRAAETALRQHHGILPLSAWKENGSGMGDCLHRRDWRQTLEGGFLGTTGVISLKNCGLDLEEECLVIFQELVQSYSTRAASLAPAEVDRELIMGVDLLIDIRRLLELARSEALEVTRDGTVFRKTEERLGAGMLSSHHRELFESSPVQHLLVLCRRLQLLDQDDHVLRADPLRRKIWLKRNLTGMIRSIFEIYQNDYRGARWSFHQRAIRELFLNRLLSFRPGIWLAARPLFAAVVAEFLASLEKQEVAQTFRNLKMEEFHNETLMVPLERLHQDLSYWVIHRLALTGLVDAGFREGNFQTLRISSLGSRFFKLEGLEPGEGKLTVNPDFEVLLFPGGKDEAETNYFLGSIADRSASEVVKRYRITAESIKRGVISGLSSDEVLAFLEEKSRNQIPPNVRYTIREWAEGIEPVLKQRVLLLKSRTADGAAQLSKILEENDIPHERIGETAVIVRGARNERALRDLQDTLRNAGLFLE